MPETGRPVLGLVTIGQSPRSDVLPQMLPYLPRDLDIRQAGALDGLSNEQIAQLASDPDEYLLHTRLRDGSAVTVGRAPIVSLLQARIEQLEHEGASIILLLCTGEFPSLQSSALLVEPDRLLASVLKGLRPQRLGVFVPLPSQIEAAAVKWEALAAEKFYAAASPYRQPDEIVQAASELQAHPVDLIVMDCMGYTGAHKRLVAKALGKPVVLATSLSARLIGELLGPQRP
jgi:protein AroM